MEGDQADVALVSQEGGLIAERRKGEALQALLFSPNDTANLIRTERCLDYPVIVPCLKAPRQFLKNPGKSGTMAFEWALGPGRPRPKLLLVSTKSATRFHVAKRG